jgi:hypothetical protein
LSYTRTSGAPCRTRTRNNPGRSRMLCPVELREHLVARARYRTCIAGFKGRSPTIRRSGIKLDDPRGFEPRPSESESDVLPAKLRINIVGAPCETRTRTSALRGRRPDRLDEWCIVAIPRGVEPLSPDGQSSVVADGLGDQSKLRVDAILRPCVATDSH